MSAPGDLDPAQAVQDIEGLARSGKKQEADRMLRAVSAATAYDRPFREALADALFDQRQANFSLGTRERSHLILYVMYFSFPSKKLIGAYFENLERLLQAGARRRTRRGTVVLGIGAGRCGSTTLAGAFTGVRDACATHENPPHVYWEPLQEQVQFHMDRFRLLSEYSPLVFDSAHWWIHLVDRFFAEFPTGKAIGLVRDTEPCIASLLKFHGRGRASVNNWAPAGNGVWSTGIWDPTFPGYPVPAGLVPDSDAAYEAKAAMITRYVTQYNQTLATLAVDHPQRFILVRTEALNDSETWARLSALVDVPVAMPKTAFNVDNNYEGAWANWWI